MKNPLVVLALARDMGAGNVIAPTLQELERRGCEIALLAERDGHAKDCLRIPFTIIGDSTSLERTMRTVSPDLCISGLSAPRVLEHELDHVAAREGKPLIHIEDYWGSHTRSNVRADLYLTIDDAAERLVKKTYPQAHVRSVGFAGISAVMPSQTVLSLFRAVRKGRHAKILVYPDGGPESRHSLPRLVEAILRTRSDVVLVPKFHPKFAHVPHPDGGTWEEWCWRVIRPLCEANKTIDMSAYATDEVVEAADGVVSGYSSTLMRAAKAGKVALTVWDEAVSQELEKSTGLRETPLMMRRVFPVLREPHALDDILASPQPVLNLALFDARGAAEEILSLR